MASVIRELGQPSGFTRRQPGSHQELGLLSIVGVKMVELLTTWRFFNASPREAVVDVRMRLNQRKDLFPIPFPDDTWVESLPGDGLVTDIFGPSIGIPAQVVPTFATRLPPGETTIPLSMLFPGPAASSAALDFWSTRDANSFNFLVEMYEVPFSGALLGQSLLVASHEFKEAFTFTV